MSSIDYFKKHLFKLIATSQLENDNSVRCHDSNKRSKYNNNNSIVAYELQLRIILSVRVL